MNRRGFLTATASVAVLSVGCARTGSRPNLVLIVTSGQHADTVHRMPALSRLAARGVSFENSYCAAPAAGPSRAALLTGRMPSETGVIDDGRAIQSGIPNVGEWLRQQGGYETYYCGRWDLPRPYQEPLSGFKALPGGIERQESLGDDAVSRASQAFLSSWRGRVPFLLVIGLSQPGGIGEWLRINSTDLGELPYREIRDDLPPLPGNFDYETIEPKVLQELRQRQEPAAGEWSEQHWRYYLWSYRRYLETVDGQLGRILDALDVAEMGSDTAVVLTSDHGEGLGHHRLVRAGSSYEESLKTPLVMSWPGRLPEGWRDSESVVGAVDIVPTLAEMAGVEPPPGFVAESLLPIATDRSVREGYRVAEIPPNVGRAVRSRRHKYVTFAGDTADQLFDILDDSGETRNLAGDAAKAPVLEEHKRLLRDWEARLNPAPGLPNESVWWRV